MSMGKARASGGGGFSDAAAVPIPNMENPRVRAKTTLACTFPTFLAPRIVMSLRVASNEPDSPKGCARIRSAARESKSAPKLPGAHVSR
jgi:hypothetical protein